MIDDRKKILVIDDEQDFLDLVRQRLQKFFQVALARDGEEGLLAVDQFKPDLILLDINMPKLNGYGFLKKLRSRKESQFIPVIVLTTVGLTSSIFETEKMGAVDYIIKPVSLEELPELLQRRMY